MNLIKKYLKQQLEIALIGISIIQAHGGSRKSIHGYRVAVKKIRAAIHFAHFLSEKQKRIKLPSALIKIFHKAGQVRELQLFHKALISAKTERKDQEKFIKEVKKELKKKVRQLQKAAAKTNMKRVRAQFKELINTLPDIEKHKVKSSFKKWVNANYPSMEGGKVKDAVLHKGRARLKEIIYVNEALKEKKKAWISGKTVSQLEKLQERMGRWHDMDLFRRFLTEREIKGKFIHRIAKETSEAKNELITEISRTPWRIISEMKKKN
jgi:CHAD domain-containing protein